MKTIYSREMRSYYNGISGYLFQLFLILSIGITCLIYNLNYSLSNFEYVFMQSSIVFIILIPLLTMKSFSEERKQKTDQLLYSLPLDMSEIVLGKYFSYVSIFCIPLVIVAVYPLVIKAYGDVYLPIAYGSLFAFILLGAAFISIGLFISSLTENQGIAAGLTAIIILFEYLSGTLAEYLSENILPTLIVLTLISFLLGVLVKTMTKSKLIGLVFGLIIEVAVVIVLFVNEGTFTSILPTLFSYLSLYEVFDVFINGVFDIKGVIYMLSVSALFIFLTIQSMERRRYN